MRDFSTKHLEVTYSFLSVIRFAIYSLLIIHLILKANSVKLIFVLFIILYLIFFYLIFALIKIQKFIKTLKMLSIYEFSSSKVNVFEFEEFYSFYKNIKNNKNILFLPIEKIFLSIILKKYEDTKYFFLMRASYRLSLEIKNFNLKVDNLEELFERLNTAKRLINYINEYIVFADDILPYPEIEKISFNIENLNYYLKNSQRYIKHILLKQHETIVELVENKNADGNLLQFSLLIKKSIIFHKDNFSAENIKLAENIIHIINIICEFLESRIKYNSISLEYIDSLNGHEFEEYCAMLLKRYGFTNLAITKGSGDQGVDIIAYLNGMKFAIQCKCYSNKLGNSPVQEVVAGKNYYGCGAAIVLTNSFFTKSAIELAKANDVLLWDREYLAALIYKAKTPWENLLEQIKL